MNAHLSPSTSPASVAPWPPPRELEALIDRLANLAAAATTESAFYGPLLKALVDALLAPRAVAWRPGRDGFWQPFCQSGSDPGTGAVRRYDDPVEQANHQRLLQQIASNRQVECVAPAAVAGEQADGGPPTSFLMLLAPVVVDGATRVLLQIDQRPQSSPEAQQGYLRFLAATAEIAADFERTQLIGKLQRRLSRWSRFEELCRELHARLDVAQTAHVVANDGKAWIECDRISVLIWKRSRLHTVAVSGVDRVNRRTATIRHLEGLAEQVARTEEPFWYSGHQAGSKSEDDASPPLPPLLHAFLDAAHPRTVGILPLVRSADRENKTAARPVGVLVLESFGETTSDDMPHLARALSMHCTTALDNAVQHQAIPLVNVIPRWMETTQRCRLGTLGAIGSISMVLLCLVFVPAELKIKSQGELQPAKRRDVFSPTDGIIDQLRVQHGQPVHAGQLLATVRSPQLEFDQRKLAGEIQTVRERLNAAEVSQIEGQQLRVDARDRYHRLTAEKRELSLRLRTLQQQQEILRQQQQDLQIISPIHGQIITWNLTQQLEARPVNRGEVLMTVVDVEGPWHLELRIPESNSGYVMDSQSHADETPVTFVLDSHPARRHDGRLTQVASAAEFDRLHGATVAATVAVDASLPGKRPGATVTAQVHCGRHALGFVWFHELIEAVHVMWAY